MSQDCWNSIGVRGDGSCPELERYVHCRNCPVYSAAAQALFDRPLSSADIAERTAHFATPMATDQASTESIVIFRIASEWLALPIAVVEEVAPVRAIHSLPHRRDGAVLGVTNVRGELLVCVSLEHLLTVERSPESKTVPHHAVHKRLLVMRRDDTRAVCPADEVHGIYRVRAGELQDVPVTVAKAAGRHARAVLHGAASRSASSTTNCCSTRFNGVWHERRNLGELSMLNLFRMEAESQAEVLTAGLLALERDGSAADQLELCMRAAHSLKGAARVVGLDVGVRVAHAMEDCFVAAQQARITLGHTHIDRLLKATDLLVRIGGLPDLDGDHGTDAALGVDVCLSELARVLEEAPAPERTDLEPAATPTAVVEPVAASEPAPGPGGRRRDNSDRVLRVSAENLNRLLGLAGESLVESRSVKPFADSLLRLKRMQQQLTAALDELRHLPASPTQDEQIRNGLVHARQSAQACQQFLSERLDELEMFDRRSVNLAHRLYDGALACRMRPFADGIVGFPRMVREVAQTLGKQVRLDIIGEATQVDRDVLVQLDAPLGHLLRNAIDHGIETPAQRRSAGKPAEGVIRIEASHRIGALHISISDDGGGVDLEKTRKVVVERRLLNRDAAETLTEPELLEFLFLPGFTMKTTVTDVSGRGVGLDVVQDMVKQVRGVVRVFSERGIGTTFRLQLPVTLSIVRTLLAEVGGEPYAFPLAAIVRTLKLPNEKIAQLEGRQHFEFDGRRIGLVTAHQVLEVTGTPATGAELPVIVLGDHSQAYGLVVDRFIGERELVVQRLDPQLGKIRNISSAALMENGSPVLIVDPEDLIRSMDRLVSTGGLSKVTRGAIAPDEKRRKRVLVVDDSLTVRELERKVLGNHGYDVEVAVDGMDGWNAARMGDFDLVITDIDMPRMDGIELVKLINGDPRLKSRPVMIVSYKDRDEDRRRGLEAGAAYYLTKGSFHDDALLQAVVDLIGEAAA